MKLIAFCAVIGVAVGYDQRDSPPQWDPVYSVKGVLNVPYAELHDPFYAWFDGKNGESRIDYYGGVVKTYQLTGSVYPPFGTSVKIGPETKKTEMRKQTCLHVDGTSDNLQEIQSVLPDMTDFKYIGTENIQASNTSKWQMIQTIDDKINEYTMWVKYRKSLRGDSVAVPVRYEVKRFNSHYDHYYLDYSDYNVDEIHPDVFKVSTFQCGSFPEPDKPHFATYNPMKEFVHPVHTSVVDMELTSYSTNEHPSVNHLADSESGSRSIRSTSDTRSTRSCSVTGSGTCSGTCTVVGSGQCRDNCVVIGSGTCRDNCIVVGSGHCSGSCTVIGSHTCSGSNLIIAGYTLFGSA